MPDDHELATIRARQAWVLRVARMTDPRQPTLAEVAKAAGLGEGSGSVVSLWENNKAKSGPKLDQLRRMAAFYGLPLSAFTEPDETDEDRLARMRRLAIAAIELEAADADQEAEGDPGDEDGPGEPPRRSRA